MACQDLRNKETFISSNEFNGGMIFKKLLIKKLWHIRNTEKFTDWNVVKKRLNIKD